MSLNKITIDLEFSEGFESRSKKVKSELALLAMAENGDNRTEAARWLGISYNEFKMWCSYGKQRNPYDKSIFENRERETCLHFIKGKEYTPEDILESEIEKVKTTSSYRSATEREREEIIQRHREKYNKEL